MGSVGQCKCERYLCLNHVDFGILNKYPVVILFCIFATSQKSNLEILYCKI